MISNETNLNNPYEWNYSPLHPEAEREDKLTWCEYIDGENYSLREENTALNDRIKRLEKDLRTVNNKLKPFSKNLRSGNNLYYEYVDLNTKTADQTREIRELKNQINQENSKQPKPVYVLGVGPIDNSFAGGWLAAATILTVAAVIQSLFFGG